ncbi:MAG: ribosome biogenesis GTPase Der [Chlamydiales bacterium]
MSLKKLAIVGRPNVGKSALFNRICKKRVAIVDSTEGVTRDRNYAQAEIFGYPFEVIDSGGIDPHSKDEFKQEILRQAQIAIEEADVLILVVDGQIGLTDIDAELAKRLLKINKPLILAVNKVDTPDKAYFTHQFHALGIKQTIPVSATQGYMVAELLETALKDFVDQKPEIAASPTIKLSIIGRANVGKSTLLNSLIDEKRCLVSPIPGTTRDSLDIPFRSDGKDFILIDTAGIRRKKSEKDVIEKFAAIRTEEAIERSDICLLVLDAQEGVSAQDKRIASQIEKSGKGCLVLLNKWDLVKGFRMEGCLRSIREECPFLNHCPIIFTSAQTGRNLEQIIPEAVKVYTALTQRMTTHQLNTFIEKAIQLNPPSMINGKRLRIYYLTQVASAPPRFVLFVNNTELLTDTYKRYLTNQFRLQYNLLGTPIRISLKGKKVREKPGPKVESFTHSREKKRAGR